MVGTILLDTSLWVRHEVDEAVERREAQHDKTAFRAWPRRHVDADGLPDPSNEVLAMRRYILW